MAEPQRLDAAHRGTWHPGKQSSRSFPLSSWIFPPLSSVPLVPVFSLSIPLPPPPPRLLLLLRPPCVLARLHLEPALFLSRFYLGLPSPTRRRRRRRRCRRRARSRSSPSFSTFTLLSLLFCSPPAAFLPLLRCRFRRNPRRVPIIPVCASSETVSSSLLLLPRASVLPLATLTACVTRRGIRRPGRNPAPGKRPCEAEEEEEEERDGNLEPRFLRY